MSENNRLKTIISQAESIEGIAEFWDTHSLADYWDETHEVKFEVRIKRPARLLQPRRVNLTKG